MAYYIRSDMAFIQVALAGVAKGDLWATFEGGGLEADDQKTRPGGMKRQVAIGGPTSRQDVTVTTQMTDGLTAVAKEFESAAGRKTMTVTVTYLDEDGNAVVGNSFSVKGKVKSAVWPSLDVNSGDVAFLSVTASLDEDRAS
jgi:hypothetical protein